MTSTTKATPTPDRVRLYTHNPRPAWRDFPAAAAVYLPRDGRRVSVVLPSPFALPFADYDAATGARIGEGVEDFHDGRAKASATAFYEVRTWDGVATRSDGSRRYEARDGYRIPRSDRAAFGRLARALYPEAADIRIVKF